MRWAVVVVLLVLAGGGAWALTRGGSLLLAPVAKVAKVEPGPLVVGMSARLQARARSGATRTRSGRKGVRSRSAGEAFTCGDHAMTGARRRSCSPFTDGARTAAASRRGSKWSATSRTAPTSFTPTRTARTGTTTAIRDIDFVASILDALAKTYCVDTTRVLALGFSYGGRFVNHLACRAPTLVRGAVIAASRWDKSEPASACAAPMPVLVVHRTRDATMPLAGGRDAAERWAKIDRCAGTEPITNGCLAWTGCAAGAVTFCEDTHYDPAWPSAWNHTMRESYELLAWRWFEQLR